MRKELPSMSPKSDPDMGINSWLEDELYLQYLHDHSAVDESWRRAFEKPRAAQGNGGPVPAMAPAPSEQLQPLRGAAGRIAENMAASLAIPLATSQRTIAVKVMDENRRIINQHRTLLGRGKVSYTHLVGWALVKALGEFPGLNHAYTEEDGQPFRVVRPHINLGIAVDVAGKDGSRNLMVPNIRNAGALNFQEYVTAFDDLVSRARGGKLTSADFQGVNAPTSLDQTSVTIGGKPAFVGYISPGQVNVQVPSGLLAGQQPLTVTTPSGSSVPYMVNVNATQPGLFAPRSFSVGGKQYVMAIFPDWATFALPSGAVSGLASRPAKPGDTITMWGIGFGPVIPDIPAGQIVQQNNTLAGALQIFIGGVPAQVQYSGLAPQAVGLYQFNVVVPNVTGSDTVPLTFTLGGVSGAQTLYVAVQN